MTLFVYDHVVNCSIYRCTQRAHVPLFKFFTHVLLHIVFKHETEHAVLAQRLAVISYQALNYAKVLDKGLINFSEVPGAFLSQ